MTATRLQTLDGCSCLRRMCTYRVVGAFGDGRKLISSDRLNLDFRRSARNSFGRSLLSGT